VTTGWCLHQPCSSIVSASRRRVRTIIPISVGLAITVVFATVATTADASRERSGTPAASCVVDATDWPFGILPDEASAAFGPETLAACKEAVRGALPDAASTLFDQVCVGPGR
jgi:hypothetical protein